MIRNLADFRCGQRGQCGQTPQTGAIASVPLSTLFNLFCPHHNHSGQRLAVAVDSITIDISIAYELCPHCPRCPHQKTGACQMHGDDSDCFLGGVQWDFGNRSSLVS